jgi:endonuclease/exonuclease/phosphatase (EEP) superfamily protein YafD
MLDSNRITLASRLALWLLVVATLFGFAGSWWWLFDLFSHFRIQYLVVALLLALILVVLRDRRWALIAVAVAAVNLFPVVPLFLSPVQAAPPAARQPLRLVSFNVFGFNREYARLLDYVARERPDVLVLLEVTPEWMPSVRELAREYPHQWIHAGDDVSGIAVMSRTAPLTARSFDLGGNGVPSYLLTAETADGPLSVLGTHLNWPIGARASRLRNSQLAALAQIAHEHAGPLVIVGDLNITPFSPLFQRLLRDGGLHRCVPDAGLTPTWPANFPPLFIQIDHCLATAGVQSRNFAIGEYLGSDHYPIAIDVAPVPALQSLPGSR